MKKLFKGLLISGLAATALVGVTSCGENKEESHAIKVYTRDTESGTRDGFFTGIGFADAVKDNTVLAKGHIEVAGNGDMITQVKNDEYSIGYISLSTLDSSLKGLSYEGVAPTEANVINGTYKLTRNFNYCKRASYSSETNQKIVEAFIAYMSTTDGIATIKDKGGILDVPSTAKSWSEVKANYAIASSDNSNVTITVGGSTSVKSIVSQLLLEFSSKCGNFKYNYNPTGSGDAYKRTNGSDKDSANACDLAFASREFKDSEAMDASLKGKMCTDAIVAVVNKSNSYSSTTASALKDIYNGTTTTWEELK